MGHLVSGSGESKGPAALLWGRIGGGETVSKQGPTAHLLPAAALAAGCNALQEEKVGKHS